MIYKAKSLVQWTRKNKNAITEERKKRKKGREKKETDEEKRSVKIG